jgi:hypothetical protein
VRQTALRFFTGLEGRLTHLTHLLSRYPVCVYLRLIWRMRQVRQWVSVWALRRP